MAFRGASRLILIAYVGRHGASQEVAHLRRRSRGRPIRGPASGSGVTPVARFSSPSTQEQVLERSPSRRRGGKNGYCANEEAACVVNYTYVQREKTCKLDGNVQG